MTPLLFSEFFVRPVGPRGLVLTEKIRGLDGKRVRILGYMARRDEAPPGTLLLAPYPVQLHDHEYGLADDLPPATVHVIVPAETGELPHTPGPLLLTGRLDLGGREEPDGRVSTARLVLDPRPAGQERPLTSVEPVSAFGRGASAFTGVMDNTDVFFKAAQAAVGGAR